MNVQSLPSMTIDRFFDWYETQDRKYELVEGVPRMQPYVKRNHALIVSNAIHYLMQALNDGTYDVIATDFAIRTSPETVRFPDIIVERRGGSGDDREARQPLIVMEILSESTQHIDFGEKRHEYLALDSLDSYVVLSQDKPYVWQWTRDQEGKWPLEPEQIYEKTAAIELPRLGVSIKLAAIYRGIC